MFLCFNSQKKTENGGIPIKNKRRLLSVPPVKASLTVEAAVVLPLFLLFMAAILSFFLLLSLQSEIQLSMEETARSLGKKAYLAEHLTVSASENGPEEETAGALSAAINPFTIKAQMLKDGLSEVLDSSRIRGGANGLYVYHSNYDRKEGILDIVVNYTYVFPFLPERFGAVRFVQRSRSHVWTGKRLKDSKGAASEEKTVYITPSGKVYHLSTACPYLGLSVRAVSGAEVDALRNKDGKIYYRCTDCCRKKTAYGQVYITDYGTNYHADLQCSGLKRTVEAVPLSAVGSRHVCSRCRELFGGKDE